uniref:Uncharacterized protein n=1 Tax=Setaria italica TaxID=4555 RepID=K3ZGG5_SETIT
MFLKASLKISCYLANNSLHQRRDIRRYLILSLMKMRLFLCFQMCQVAIMKTSMKNQ